MADLQSIHQRMCQEIAAAGAMISDGYCCPHDLQPPCGCRKPAPGMLQQAARDHDIDLFSSWMIGDSDIDVEAGKSAGCRTARILKSDEQPSGRADIFADSLFTAVQQVLRTPCPLERVPR